MAILVTGAAGFIGFHLSKRLLQYGASVIGIDNLNDYYSVPLKTARLAELERLPGFEFHQINIAEAEQVRTLKRHKVDKVVHLAAQAGVRYSIRHPEAYVQSNLVGHFNILEYCRHLDGLDHLIFASSSSVYGSRTTSPFHESDNVDKPISLYAATKKSNELMSYSYAHLFGLPQTALRFFTVYGPWGRPDMAYWLFTKAIMEGRPIKVFNHGDMRRDFTYIDDVIDGLMSIVEIGPKSDSERVPYKLYNIGNNRTEKLLDMIAVLERSLGRKAVKEFQSMQPGDVKETFADISLIQEDYQYNPQTTIDEGLPLFIDWYRRYHNL